MRLYGLLDRGLLDRELDEIIEFYATEADANATRAEILNDEPGWESKLEVVRVDFSGAEVQIERASSLHRRMSGGAD